MTWAPPDGRGDGGLKAAAVAEFDDCRWIDIDADDFDPGRQQIAAPLDDALREEILSMARKALKTEPALHVSVDPSLIAGIVIRIGDRVFDGSVLNRMNQLRKTIVSRAVERIETRPEEFIT